MNYPDLQNIPYMLYADRGGQVYEHPYYRMVGFSGADPVILRDEDLIPLPEYSKLFFIPDCPPMGLDPATGEIGVISRAETSEAEASCYAVAAFLEPGLVRSLLPAVDYGPKSYTLPTWAYTAVGFRDHRYWVAGFRIEHNHRWDPRNYDDRRLTAAMGRYRKENPWGPLVEHLAHCALHNHCFAAKNLFLRRWEAPLPLSRGCNAECLGCLSDQTEEGSCQASHQRISFRPSRDEVLHLAVQHLREAEEPIVSFGQGCEGEPLTEYRLIAEIIEGIRRKTSRGTINLNTNGSWPERVRMIAKSGLDSIRISLNSARPAFYDAYYRPRNYRFEDVVEAISLSKEMGLYTMINYLVFPGITDQEEEIEALVALLKKTGVNFVHLKNLNIDPQRYLEGMPKADSRAVGMRRMVGIVEEELPALQLGYFNQPVR